MALLASAGNAQKTDEEKEQVNTVTMKEKVPVSAAKTAMNLFNHTAEASAREKELMKACTDPQLFAATIGNVKISAAGLTQLKQKQKKGKKSDKKDNK
ncbi:unnamed protein product [Linum trigynum]|uniref:Uncharacterized protein n=1 Tax=Linum trigynum TaxID=586398 RepID=A0AAV2GRG6_9ROSI